jgi:hypothetical protein
VSRVIEAYEARAFCSTTCRIAGRRRSIRRRPRGVRRLSGISPERWRVHHEPRDWRRIRVEIRRGSRGRASARRRRAVKRRSYAEG